jgi:hypothetical protein
LLGNNPQGDEAMSDASSGEIISFPGRARPNWPRRGKRTLSPEQREQRRELSRRPRRSKNGTPEERAAQAAAGIKPAKIEKPVQVEKPDEGPLVFKTPGTADFMLRLHDLLLAPEAVRLRFVRDMERRWPEPVPDKKQPTLSVVPDETA